LPPKTIEKGLALPLRARCVKISISPLSFLGGGEKMTDTKVGQITHYYDKIGVAVVSVMAPIKTGDKIKIVGKTGEFEQEVSSMQVEHKAINEAKKSDQVGMKVDKPVKEGDEVFRVE
jgi:hypothetical protein